MWMKFSAFFLFRLLPSPDVFFPQMLPQCCPSGDLFAI
jgi:hypothetical protein